MPKYRIQVRVEEYMDYVVEAASEDEAIARGQVDSQEGMLASLVPTVEAEEVEPDTPEGDVG